MPPGELGGLGDDGGPRNATVALCWNRMPYGTGWVRYGPSVFLAPASGGQRPTMMISRSDGPVVARPLRWLLVRPASAGGVVAAVPPLAASAFAAADSAAAVSVAGAGVGDGSVVIKTIWFFFVSSVQVLARALVCTVCSTSKLMGPI